MKLLTVTVPSYNSEGYMKHCIESLLVGGERVEIIIVDDGSKDSTGKIADEYQEKYPTIVKAIHQENGGHGEGINTGIKNATGVYFKVVDSDDWVCDQFAEFLDKLEALEKSGGADLVCTNYYYEHADGKDNRSISYKSIFPCEGKVVTWSETKKCNLEQLFNIHCTMFRTEILRESKMVLPKHIFYEDNLSVYTPMPYVKTLCYFDVDLYRYFIGREGQSVSEEMLKKRYTHQLTIASLVFEAHDLDKIKTENAQLYNYLHHEVFMMFALATCFARLVGTEQSEKDLSAMWQRAMDFNPTLAKHFRYHTALKIINHKGKLGIKFTRFIYRLAHKIVKFN